MGFNLTRNPNPLVGALNTLTQSYTKRATEDRENKLIGDAFKKLQDPNVSPLERLSTISQLDVSPEKRKMLSEGFETINKQAEKTQQLQQERARNIKVAQNLGLENPEQYADLEPTAIVAIHKQKNPKIEGGKTAQEVPEGVAAAIKDVLTNNPKASADDLTLAFNEKGVPPLYSNPYTENRRRTDEAKAATNSKRAEKVLEENDQLRNLLPSKQAALDAMKDSVMTDDLSFFSPNSLADLPGGEWLRTAAGGQFKTAGKTFFISNVQKFGARPNMYVEQQVSDMLPKIGRSRAGNLAGLQMFEFEQEVENMRVETLDNLEDEYIEKGNVPGTIGKEANKKMKKYIADRQKQLGDNLKLIREHEAAIDAMPKGNIFMLDPQGKPLYVTPDQVDYAIEKGARRL
jgi:hypothetical protein